MVTCHLGAGASLAAVRDGCSVDTTMGFTPLEGLVMATRSGSLDPGLVLWLQEHVGTPSEELAAALEHRSGLLGLAGTADMREVLIAAGVRGDDDADASGPATTIVPADARLALDVYVHRLRAGIAAMAAALGGLDAVAFTGGVGENAPEVRRLAAEGLGFLGLAVDRAPNEDGDGDREIGAPGAAVRSVRRRVARGPRDRPLGAARPRSGAPRGPAAGVRAGSLTGASEGAACTQAESRVSGRSRASPGGRRQRAGRRVAGRPLWRLLSRSTPAPTCRTGRAARQAATVPRQRPVSSPRLSMNRLNLLRSPLT